MKKMLLVICAVALFSIVSGVDSQPETDVLNIEVPLEGMKGRSGRIHVSIMDVNDGVVGGAQKYFRVTGDYHSVPLRVALQKRIADRDLLRVKVEFGKETRIYSLHQLEDRMVVQIMGQDDFISGTPVHYRIIARNQRNNAPLKGARVKITMVQGTAGKIVFEGSTDQHGSCATGFDLPADIDEVQLHFEVSSALGRDNHDVRIKIIPGDITYLVTDKPVYQPGQTIHIRSLSLRRPGLEAVHGVPLLLEVEDSRGNKV
ncbi:hypothetical protein IBX73_09005, partial [candidate division WOR-3 bacterium]|nr:hypothetical protein [candidate division WOR-3 bacterium]